ncbi:MAG: hypothetical protein ABL963_06550 [Longimicrobiales bacterium]
MPTTRMIRLSSLAVLGLFAAACESSTGPVIDLDFAAASADYEVVDSIFATPAWSGFQALGTRTPFGVSPAALEAVSSLDGAARGNGRSFALQLARRMHDAVLSGGRPAMTPIISNTHRGETFVYVPALDEYAVDSTRTGAPATGVRFVVYEVDSAGIPIVTEEIGYADLIDEGDTSAEDVALRLVVVANSVTVLDYATTLDLGLVQGTLTVDGFVQGANGVRLDFAIEAVGTHFVNYSTLDLNFDLAVDARDFSITGEVVGVREGVEGEGDVDLTVQHRSHSVRLDVNGSAGILDGSVFVDGQLFATIDGPAATPTILSADGDALTTAEVLVLHHIVDVVEDIFDFLEDLVDPVDEIVILGVIL